MYRLNIFFIWIVSLLFFSSVHAELRDPTMPTLNPAKFSNQLQSLKLSGIIFSYGRKIAIINGEKKKAGENIMGYRILFIKQNAVQLEGPSGKITLFLLDNSVKKLSAP